MCGGLYDGVLGMVFLLAGPRVFDWYGVTPPNHPGYIEFPALLLLIFAALFFRIAIDPVQQRALIWYGVALKFAYCTTVFRYQVAGDVPAMWLPWAWADLVFLVLFLVAWKQCRPVAAT